MNMKRALFALITLLIVINLFSARLMNQPITVTQPDGSQLNVLASGDEFHNWLHNSDNYTIIQHPTTGYYVWAISRDGKVVAGNDRVDSTDPATLGIPTGVNLTPRQMIEKRRQFWGSYGEIRDTRVPHFGTINNLVIYINFADSPAFTHGNDYYVDMFNNDTPDYNSQRNYFLAASYNQLDIETHFFPAPVGNTIVCYTDPQPRGYYEPLSVTNTIGYDENNGDERAAREFALLTAAVSYVAPFVPTTLDLDGDDDGNIDNICFNVQGSPNGWATLLWPHRWAMYGAEAYVNGSRAWDFNLQLESFLDGSGTSVLCHEMTHTLGSPDFYRYSDGTIDPIGSWDLMCGNTNPPQSMSCYIKSKYLDWVGTVPTISQSGTYTINPVWNVENNIYRIPSWRTGEYYIVEYRKPSGIYDTEIPGQGLLIYRLNTAEDGNADGPPDELYLYRPGGINTTTNGIVNMANYSAQVGRTAINETTVPSGFLSNEMPGGLDISEISASGGETMSFKVVVSNVQVTYPREREVLFGGTPLTITWKARSANGNVRIEFSSDAGTTWSNVITTAPNNGSYTWNALPVLDSEACLIKVTILSGGATDTGNYPFTILSTIASPAPLFPSDGLQNAPTNPTFTWGSVPGADSYHLQIATNPAFEPTFLNLIDLPDTTFFFNNLQTFTTYYWQVAAYSSIGLSAFCPMQTFTTGQITQLPNVPALILPLNNSLNQPLNLQIRWAAANLADSYHYQVATNNFFSNIVQEDSSFVGTELNLNMLSTNTRYYWRVRSYNPAGYSNFTVIRSFTTGTTIGDNDNTLTPFVNALEQNKPNPFHPQTEIAFSVKDLAQRVQLNIYNTKGQLIKSLIDGTAKSHQNRLVWDGRDAHGKQVSSGIYYYILQTADYRSSRKMLMMK